MSSEAGCAEEPMALESIEPGLKQVLTGAEGLGTLPGQAETLVACLTGMGWLGRCQMGHWTQQFPARLRVHTGGVLLGT